MQTFVALMDLAAGLVIVGVGVPLWLGRVPPNPMYGARFRKSFESTDLWYRLNRFGGRAFVAAGAVVAAVGCVGALWPAGSAASVAWLVALTVVPLAAVLVSSLATWRYVRTL